MLSRQLPAHSPVDLPALAAGLAAALRGERSGARGRIRRRLRERFPAEDVLLTDSGTTALALALTGADGSGEGGMGGVALPAYGCYDLATAADAAGVEVSLYDLQPSTLSPDPESVRAALADGASALVVAPLYGVPVEMSFLIELALGAGARVVEDAAQGAGASLGGRPVGSDGDLTVLSFGRGKGITGGGGGALLGVGPGTASILEEARPRLGPGGRGWAALALTAAQWGLGRPALYGLPASLPFLNLGETVYRDPEPPDGMPAACAGVLTRTLDLQEGEAGRRRTHAARLRVAAERSPGLRAVTPPEASRPGWLRFPVIARTPDATSRLTGRRARQLGIVPGYPKPLPNLEGFRQRCRNADDRFPGAEELASGLFTLPTHGRLREEDLNRIVDLLAEDDTSRAAPMADGTGDGQGRADSGAT